MSFRGQVVAAGVMGGGLLLIGLMKLAVGGGKDMPFFFGAGATILLFGCVLRVAARRAWLRGGRDPGAGLGAALVRFWLGVPPDGRSGT